MFWITIYKINIASYDIESHIASILTRMFDFEVFSKF